MLKGYTTKEDVENYLLVEIDESFDDQVDDWIEAVEEYIDNETSKDFSVSDDTASDRLYDGDGSQTIEIDPAKEVTSVKLYIGEDAIDSDQYVLYPANKTIKTKIKLKYLTFPKGDQNITVNAKFGLTEVPKDIKFAATVLVAGIVNNSYQSNGEVQSISIGRYQVTYKDEQSIKDFAKVDDILAYNKRFTF